MGTELIIWDKVSNADIYEIYRKIDSGTVSENNFTDKNIPDDLNVRYTVTCISKE